MISALDILSSHAAAQRRADKVRVRVRVTRVRVRVTLTLTTLTPTRRETASGSLWLLGRTAGEEVANSNPNPDPYPDPDPNPDPNQSPRRPRGGRGDPCVEAEPSAAGLAGRGARTEEHGPRQGQCRARGNSS